MTTTVSVCYLPGSDSSGVDAELGEEGGEGCAVGPPVPSSQDILQLGHLKRQESLGLLRQFLVWIFYVVYEPFQTLPKLPDWCATQQHNFKSKNTIEALSMLF